MYSREAREAREARDAHVSRSCPQLPGTILRVFIPAGAVINFLNLIEFSSPGGICFIVRLPFLGGSVPGGCGGNDIAGLMDSVRAAGGTVEVVN
jgi:hypothetical protein